MSKIERALSAWRKAIGEDYVIGGRSLDSYIDNTYGLTRRVPAVVMPSDTDEVQCVVEIANEFGTPLYPISKGKNWGLGSKLPVKDDTTILDLGRMDRIHDVNTKHAYVVLEPGVTQGQLYAHLKENNIPLIMDVTGSGLDSSILGNALDRGVGYFSDRCEELSDLQVVLGNGEILETGFSRYPNAKAANLFKHGVGPYLDGLFVQSNMGAVTRAGVGLMQESDDYATFVCKLGEEEQLPEFVDAMAKLKKMGIIRSVAHIGNRERTKITICPLIYDTLKEYYPDADEGYLRGLAEELFESEDFGPWSATGRVFGTRAQVNEAKRQIKGAIKKYGDVTFLTDRFIRLADTASGVLKFIPQVKRKRILLSSIKPVYNFTKGIPTDDAVKSVYWPLGLSEGPSEPDHTSCGVIYYLPITPLDGEEAERVAKTTNEVLSQHGFTPSITLNTVNDRAMETVISIPFNRENQEDTLLAQESVRKLHKKLTSEGIYPYRASVDLMEDVVDPENPFWRVSKQIKEKLDPNNIISPGRYSLV